jgi:photosystem II stability/assembly factor-like uncharacterized protein
MLDHKDDTTWLGTSVSCFIGWVCLVACASGFAPARWQKITESTQAHVVPFLSIFFFDSDHGIAITPVSLEKTDSGGKSWATLISGEGEKSFYSLAFTSPTKGYVTGMEKGINGYAPVILRTEDGGGSWQKTSLNIPTLTPEARPRLHSISFCNGQIGWAAGSDLILETTDGGRDWETKRIGKDELIFGVGCISDEQAFAVGQNGLMLQTKDGGNTWDERASGTNDSLLRVRFFGNDGWIVGGMAGRSVLLRTRDAGVTWQSEATAVSEVLFDIYVNGTQGWLVGANGTILQTKDGGQTWQRQESATTNDLTCLFFLSPQRGWVGGDKQTLLKYSAKSSERHHTAEEK